MFTSKNTELKKIIFYNYESQFRKEYEYLLNYFELNSDRAKVTIKELEGKLRGEILKNPDDESKINDLYETKLKSITSFYFHSAIILVHSYFESQLIQICNLVREETRNKFGVSELKGSDLIKLSLDYLLLTTNVNKELLDKHKPRLGKFQKLRNRIIHDNSTYAGDEDKRKLKNDFGDEIEFNEVEMKFFIQSDILPKEYLERTFDFVNQVLSYLKSVDFLMIVDDMTVKTEDLPF